MVKYCNSLPYITEQPVPLFFGHFGFEWSHNCYIQWQELVSAVMWEGTHDRAILHIIKCCTKCAMAVVIVKKDQYSVSLATGSIFIDVRQHI